jgi:YgiT-type zinc finger domain-containing protein
MICVVYKHAELEAGKDTSVFERNGMTLVIQDVPKLICPNRGEEYTDPTSFGTQNTACFLKNLIKSGILVLILGKQQIQSLR